MRTKFWIVAPRTSNFSRAEHRKKYASLDEARVEAQRKAEKFNKEFVVLEAVGSYRPTAPPVVWEYFVPKEDN